MSSANDVLGASFQFHDIAETILMLVKGLIMQRETGPVGKKINILPEAHDLIWHLNSDRFLSSPL